MLRRRILIATGALALTVPTVAYAEPGADRFEEAPSSSQIDSSFTPGFLDSDSPVTVMVELAGDPVAVVEARSAKPLTASRAAQLRSGLKKSQDRVKSEIQSRGGTVFSQMQSAFNGMRVSLPRKQLSAVSQLPGVASVQAVPTYRIENATSVPFLDVPQVWQNSKYRGKGVKVAVIDTGIDYTHADFGGPGTVASYKKAKASNTPNPKWFGPKAPRVKGGYDFVGDAYDPDKAGSKPEPDANPLDCQGHGSHVAGTAAGGGVTADGKAFTGPYGEETSKRSFTVGPGVAPQADLYALKVFGCGEVSTDVITEAIDWAVKNRMDVINMSLGAPFGRADDADAIAARNAQAAGVIVVAAAGNEGPNPYLAGSPGAGQGVISVGAIDSTATFPGATLTFNGTTMAATNANGATMPSTPLTIVNLTDDPKTEDDESLGCEVSDYTRVGIKKSGNQIAVTTRGVCARVARGVYGQKAGAKAVVMVNTSATYPPYEGEILTNPDDEEDYTVTIPFVGVRSTDAAALKAADGKPLTLAAGDPVANADFRKYASFSSAGPLTGDSGLKPSLSAPGVNIRSVAVGTGNGMAVNSGTSMASPHVAGVAALAKQAHKKWSARELSAALVTTADPAKVTGYGLTLGGGLVDAKQVTSTSIYAVGDRYSTSAGTVYDGTLSFGFHEFTGSYSAAKKLTLVNKGAKKVAFTLKNATTAASVPAKVSLSRTKVTVAAKSSKTVKVTLSVPAKTVGSSLDSSDRFGFRQASGNITITTNGKGTLRVPYLMVPRAQAKVSAKQTVVESGLISANTTATQETPAKALAESSDVASPLRYANVTLTNPKGALRAGADVYTWGLQDPQDVKKSAPRGIDLRAAGVQSFEDDGKQFLVFAVNTWDRWSNAAAQEFDVAIDTDRDGKPDYVLYAVDSGQVRDDSVNGISEVFIYDVAEETLSAAGFMAQAPTDSSTILLPVNAADLGLTSKAGTFDYTVASYSQLDAAEDEIDGWARYNPWNPAISNGDFAFVPANGSTTVQLTFDQDALKSQKPLGTMVVVLDNKSGKDEARLLPTPTF
ncbi:MAG: S8 family serine peptidase [Micropruina sp.]|uniref:S8 family peptidase n=1 Tax=Micropruina sp. TaxID=2737536 RepID=UPI0039E31B82